MNTALIEASYRRLVNEENPADVHLLRSALATAELDCKLTGIDDGADALAFLRQPSATDAPELAIVDLNLPKHGGLEIIEVMRVTPAFSEVPVVILTSSSSPRDRASLENTRVRRYIVKPADLDEFMKVGCKSGKSWKAACA